MRVMGLDDKEYNWPPAKSRCCVARSPSELHIRARNVLKQLYPTMALLEEVPLPGSQLKLDFYIPFLSLAIEVQGQQHTEFTEHFHKNKFAFVKAQTNDKTKQWWCEQHNIRLVELQYDRTDDEWTNSISD